MKVRISHAFVAGLVAVAAVLPTAAGAKSGMMGKMSKMSGHHTAVKAATYKCPVCHMAMPSNATKAAPLRVHVGNHYYYCCKECGYKGDAASKPKMGKMSHMGGKMGGKMGHMSHM